MNPPRQDEILRDRIRRLLGGTLGGNPLPRDPAKAWKSMPVVAGIQVGAAYALAFCALPWIVLKFTDLKTLGLPFWLSIWGSFYVAFGTAIARSTCYAIVDTIEDRIVPGLSETATAAIIKDLDDRFQRKPLLAIPSLAALLAAVWSHLRYPTTQKLKLRCTGKLYGVVVACSLSTPCQREQRS